MHWIRCVHVCICEFPDRNTRGHGSGPTEAGSALGPDWHEGIVLRGAEEVRWQSQNNSQ